MTSRFLRSVTLAIAYSLAASAGAAPPQAPVVETASGLKTICDEDSRFYSDKRPNGKVEQ